MINEVHITTNSWRSWILAIRPKTLTGAAIPVLIGIAWALNNVGWKEFDLIPATLCLLFAFIMQIDANLVNDYFDCLKGNDSSNTRLGPKRACSEGWITLPAMRCGIVITSLLACAIGLPLIWYGGIGMVAIGLLCLCFCFLYTTHLSYLGLGDILVLIFFGLIPVCLTYYVTVPVHMQYIPTAVWLAGIGCGMVTDTLLIVNNYRDRENDLRDGKITLVVRIGSKNSEKLYGVLGYMGIVCAVVAALMTWNGCKVWIFIILLLPYLFLHQHTLHCMIRIHTGKQLNKILNKTARNMLIYGISTALSVIITHLL